MASGGDELERGVAELDLVAGAQRCGLAYPHAVDAGAVRGPEVLDHQLARRRARDPRMAPGQLRIVPEAAGMGGLPTDLQPAVEADAAAGRRAGEDVEAGIGQALAHPCCCCCWLW